MSRSMYFTEKKLPFAYLAVVMLLLRYTVITRASDTAYKVLEVYTKSAIVEAHKAKTSLTTQYSINETTITKSMNKWYFGISDCWNYSMTEDERLSDNYIRSKILRNYASPKILNISRKVVVELNNLRCAIRNTRQKLGYSRVKSTGHHYHNFTTSSPQEKRVLQAVFLTTVKKNLYLILNDIQQRIKVKA